ncbi:hypothetical protein D1007_60133 [Hordeum vulgare]|nr:hypothetical protein D1007_60133 [Hordeum vulgare]
MGFFGKGKGKGKLTPGASSSKYRQALPCPDVNLPHGWYLDRDRIPIPAVSWSARAHAEEVCRRRALLTPEQRRDPTFVGDSPEWEVWFAIEHERECIHSAQFDTTILAPPPQVKPEEQEEDATYEAALEEATAYAIEESRPEEDARWVGLEKVLALSAAGDYVVPLLHLRRSLRPRRSSHTPTSGPVGS